MSKSMVDVEKSISSCLNSINCCDRCILRFLNVKTSSKYDAEEKDRSQAKSVKHNPCSACLGLLQLEEYGDYIDKITNDVREAAYDSNEISFALSLPISLQLRNFSIWLHITQKFHSYFLDKAMLDCFDVLSDELKADRNMVSLKEAWKILVAPKLASDLNKTLNNGVDSSFHVTVNFEYSGDGEETACMAQMHPDIFADRGNQRRKYHNEVFTRKSVEQALNHTSHELFEKHSPVPPKVPNSHLTCTGLTCARDSLYIAGRYNKFSRTLSQTPWLIRGERRMDSSVEELIRLPVEKVIETDCIKFSSSGREDVDVRTLGNGRPFVLDLQNPRRTKLDKSEIKNLQNAINTVDAIRVRDLQIVPKEELVHIKAGEQTKTKTYQCYCVVGKEAPADIHDRLLSLEKMGSFVIQQRTPVRVLHRRPLAIRPRTVHWIRANLGQTEGDTTYFTLDMKVEAGTYIKELVHGDLGRTVPNISTILNVETDIVALDVTEVDLAWPPPLVDSGVNGSSQLVQQQTS